MKKIYSLLATILLCVATTQAQGWEWSVGVGYNLGARVPMDMPAEVRGIGSYTLQPCFSAGGYATYMASARWGVRTGLLYEGKGHKVGINVRNYNLSVTLPDGGYKEGYYTGNIENETMSHYLTLPLLAVFRPCGKWDIFAGFYASWAFSCTFEGVASDGSIRETPLHERVAVSSGTYDYSSHLRKYDIGAQLGGAYRFSSNWALQVALQMGFIDQLNPATRQIDQSLYNLYLNLGVTYTL